MVINTKCVLSLKNIFPTFTHLRVTRTFLGESVKHFTFNVLAQILLPLFDCFLLLVQFLQEEAPIASMTSSASPTYAVVTPRDEETTSAPDD